MIHLDFTSDCGRLTCVMETIGKLDEIQIKCLFEGFRELTQQGFEGPSFWMKRNAEM